MMPTSYNDVNWQLKGDKILNKQNATAVIRLLSNYSDYADLLPYHAYTGIVEVLSYFCPSVRNSHRPALNDVKQADNFSFRLSRRHVGKVKTSLKAPSCC